MCVRERERKERIIDRQIILITFGTLIISHKFESEHYELKLNVLNLSFFVLFNNSQPTDEVLRSKTFNVGK